MTDFIEEIEGRDLLDRAMKDLTREERSLISRIMYGESLSEIARSLDSSRQNVFNAKERAYRKIRATCASTQ